MAQTAPYQGANKCEIFSISGNAAATSLFVYDKTVDTTIEGHPVTGKLKINLTNKTNNEAWNTHLNAYLTNREVTTTNQPYENGAVEVVVGGVDTTKRVGVIWYDGHIATKRKVIVGCAVYAGATGNATTVNANIGDMPVELQFIDYGDTLTLGSDKFDVSLVSGAADVALAAGEIGCVLFLNVAS